MSDTHKTARRRREGGRESAARGGAEAGRAGAGGAEGSLTVVMPTEEYVTGAGEAEQLKVEYASAGDAGVSPAAERAGTAAEVAAVIGGEAEAGGEGAKGEAQAERAGLCTPENPPRRRRGR